VYWRRFVLLALVCAAASADEIGILTGGKRIIDRDPSSGADNCSGWVYGPNPVLDQTGRVGSMYVVTDQITNHCRNPIGSAGRFGDVIALLAHYTVCVRTLDGSAAEGLASVYDAGRSFADGLLRDGCAEIDLRMTALGAHTVTANYNTQNLWQGSFSPAVVQTVVEGERRRAVHH